MTDFEDLIDAAAKEIVAHEPSRQLRYTVMSRVHRGTESPLRRIWVVAVPSAAIACIVAAVLLYNGTPAPIEDNMMLVQTRRFAQQLLPVPTLNLSLPRISQAPASATSAVVRTAEPLARAQSMRVEPIGIETINIPPIDLFTTSIATINLANLTVEPLTASNN